MRKIIALSFLLFVLPLFILTLFVPQHALANNCLNQNTCWIAKTPIPVPLAGYGIASDSWGKIYLVNGNTGNGNSQALYVYDSISDSWTPKAPLLYQGNDLSLTYYSPTNKFYAGGGFYNGPLNNFYEYDPTTNTWTAKLPMIHARNNFSLVTSNGKIYAISDFVDEYDPITNTWITKSMVPYAVNGISITAPNGKIYVIGGTDYNTNNIVVNTVQEYDPSSNTWTTKTPMPTARLGFAISLNTQGNIDVIGGFISDNRIVPFTDTTNVEEYNPTTDSWTTKTPFPIAIHEFSAALGNDGYVHAMGGWIPNGPIINTNYAGITPNDSINLDVPVLRQTDNPWQSQLYDSANIWSPANPTINSWGCALTSAAMVLKFHGINKLPGGAPLDPGTLNSWLKSQPDGYIGNGLVNWLALSRLSRLSKDENDIASFDALEYTRIATSNSTLLANDINNKIPDILEEPGHFIVAKGLNGDTFNINDPYFSRSTLNDGYSNTFLSLGRFIPSNTDLSYIMLVADQEINIVLKDTNGNSLSEQFVQQPLANDEDANQKSGDPMKLLLFKNPPSGQYQITLTSSKTQKYDLNIYFYDKNGDVNILNLSGLIGQDLEEIFNINFNSQSSNTSSSSKIVTFQSLINDIEKAQSLKLINKGAGNSLLAVAKNAKKNYDKGLRKVSLVELGVFQKLLNTFYKIPKINLVDEKAYLILLYDTNYLKSHI